MGSPGANPDMTPKSASANAEPSAACRTCHGSRKLRVVAGTTTAAYDIDCPSCIGTSARMATWEDVSVQTVDSSAIRTGAA